MWNWTFEASVEGQVSAAAVWKVWMDVSGWSGWDDALEWCQLDGPFSPQTEGRLKPKDWPPLKFIITEVIQDRGFKDVTFMPLRTSLEFHHTVECLDKKYSRITHRVYARGLLAPILRFTLRCKLQKKMPKALSKLIEKAGEYSE